MPSKLVQSVQSFLKDSGFDPGPLDGVIGNQTVAAWNAFLDKEEGKLPPTAANAGPPVSPGPSDPIGSSDKARCDKYTREFTFPAECAIVPHSKGRIPEDVTWEDVAGDNGGVTKWGIDATGHPHLSISYIKNMTMEQALEIYYQSWVAQGCSLLPSPIAEVVHDTFESGGHPVAWLQQVLGLPVDGKLGSQTISAAHAADGHKVATAFLVKRDSYFTTLAHTVSHDAKFLKGWLNRDNNLRAYIKNL